MKGAIIGDIIGSRFEWENLKSKDFPLFTIDARFTDDSVLTLAVAHAILEQKSYEDCIRSFALEFPLAGYGGSFKKWMKGEIAGPYNSWGNGAAMRVSAIAYLFDNEEDIMNEAKKSAELTHNHPEGIKGAQAIALAIFMARKGKSKEEIKTAITLKFDYDLERTLDRIRPVYSFDVSCQGSVPESIIAFLESTDFEDAIRSAISIGGDSDTIASMTGAIAEAFYKHIPDAIEEEAMKKLPRQFLAILKKFEERCTF